MRLSALSDKHLKTSCHGTRYFFDATIDTNIQNLVVTKTRHCFDATIDTNIQKLVVTKTRHCFDAAIDTNISKLVADNVFVTNVNEECTSHYRRQRDCVTAASRQCYVNPHYLINVCLYILENEVSIKNSHI